ELSDSLRYLGAGKDEGIDLLQILVLLNGAEGLVASSLLQQVGFTGCGGLVALDAMTLNENAIDRDQISRLQIDDISDKDIVDENLLGPSRTDDLDLSIVLLLV
ncbi:hypothetical protein N0V87_010766, partial [Didymella glomerata]